MFDIERIFIVVFTTKIILHKAFDIEDAEGLQQSSHWVEHTGGWREHWLWISFSPDLSQNLHIIWLDQVKLSLDLAWIVVYEVLLDTVECEDGAYVCTRLLWRHWPVVRPQPLPSLRRTPTPPLRTPQVEH